MLYRSLIILSLITYLNLFSNNTSASENFDTGVTSLMNSVASKDYKAIEFFIKINPFEVNNQNIGGATALHLAVRNDDMIATKILSDNGADPNIKDIEGYTPAMRACFYGYNETFKVLNKNSSINFSLTNNQNDGFIILSALARNNLCLSESLKNIVPIRDLSIDELKDRLQKAFIISLAKEDKESKEILLKYLDKLGKFEKKVQQLSKSDSNSGQDYRDPPTYKVPVLRSSQELILEKNDNVVTKKVYKLTRGQKGVVKEVDKSRSKARPRIRYKIKKPRGIIERDSKKSYDSNLPPKDEKKNRKKSRIIQSSVVIESDLDLRPKKKSFAKNNDKIIDDLLINKTTIIE